ncbi:FISUMP domain-containing protein [Dysgonomonas sp. 25]|uniref:FISUMP domain-containing protein n=1 Tax=Dysgonomonas sp. 25 TaxID=2302933 RepID=UPI0013D49B37|nr:FISUMP domain-containing protein [Dysgonomonas sp. 25]NDV69195.1 hypothetical protein [Dysgonomonas sp. 25]
MTAKQVIILLIFGGLFFAGQAHSQITVGSDHKPNKGSLLDLKENASSDANATKGFGLPRVKLTDLKPTTPATLSASIGASGNWGLSDHIGLLVYNSFEDHCTNPDISQGLYVWDGEEWQPLGGNSEVHIFTDPRDGETYTYRKFGDAGIWMTQHLRAIVFPDGTPLDVHDEAISNPTKAMYGYSDATSPNWDVKPASWKKGYGVCYNYPAYTNYYAGASNSEQTTTSSEPGANEVEKDATLPDTDYRGRHIVQGICPDGWHLPSDREWNELEKEIYQNAAQYSTYTAAEVSAWNTALPWDPNWEIQPSAVRPASTVTAAHGAAMKSICPVDGGTPNGKSLSAKNGGFDLPLVGYIYGSNGKASRKSAAYLASASQTSSNTIRARDMKSATVGVSRSVLSKSILMPVRCKKNDLNL